MIHVIATIQLQPGARAQFLDAFRVLVPKVHAEEGCIDYGPTIDVETNIDAQGPPREDVVTVVEKWESLDCLEAHLIAPHMIQYRTEVKPMVVSTRIQVLAPA